jgi:hypothetical protein
MASLFCALIQSVARVYVRGYAQNYVYATAQISVSGVDSCFVCDGIKTYI